MKKEYDIEKLNPRRNPYAKKLKQNKNKTRLIVVVVLIILSIVGLTTSYIDNARVRANIEPKYTIEIISNDGRKITYWGLGYKVIRYVGVSPKEPFKNNIGLKYGNWFMKYELSK